MIILIFGIPLLTFSQSCFPDGIEFHTQAEIDNFQVNYPNCTEIEGSLFIRNNEIKNLNTLSVLTSVGENIYITNCDSLISLSGLNNIKSIGENLYVSGNFLLSNLNGLNNLKAVSGHFYISANNQLASLEGLDSLKTIGEEFQIDGNEMLLNFNGLQSLTSIGWELFILSNPVMSSLNGLNNLSSTASLIILTNDSLKDLTALSNLTSVDGILYLNYNSSLTTLKGLDNIAAESLSKIEIRGNVLLASCEVKSVCDYLAVPNAYASIFDNATGCFNKEEVEEACKASVVQEKNFNSEFSIYPNPASSILYFSSPDITISELNIYNQLGVRVLTRKYSGNAIDISTLPAGLYIIEFVTSNDRLNEILIIE